MKYKKRYCTVFVLFVLLLFQCLAYSATPSQNSHPFVVSGVIINNDNTSLIERFSQYISQLADYPLHVVYVDSYEDLSRELRDNPTAIGWTCGAPFVQDHRSDGQQLIAVPLFNHKPTYSSIILTASHRKETKLMDFEGAVFAYSDLRSNSGFLAPQYALNKHGINMKTYFRLLLNAGNHEGSIEALLNGLADVAAIDEYVWVAYLRKFPIAKTKLKELEKTGPFPFTPIVAGKNVNNAAIEKIANALVNMSQEKAGKKILSQFQLDGFVKKEIDFYKPIEKMLQTINDSSRNNG